MGIKFGETDVPLSIFLSFVIVIVPLGLIIFSICNYLSMQTGKNVVIQETNKSNTLEEYNIVIIEGCEYFRYYGLCHKGNCSNPIHKKEQQ